MLDKIEFSSSSNSKFDSDTSSTITTYRRRNISTSFNEYSINSLPRALNISYKKKCTKLEHFINRNKTLFDLRSNLSQLYGFARSADGLIKDKYRERIWPVLAESIPRIVKSVKPARLLCYKRRRSNESNTLFQSDDNGDNESDKNYNSDSDFESALSTFSNEFNETDQVQNEKVFFRNLKRLMLENVYYY